MQPRQLHLCHTDACRENQGPSMAATADSAERAAVPAGCSRQTVGKTSQSIRPRAGLPADAAPLSLQPGTLRPSPSHVSAGITCSFLTYAYCRCFSRDMVQQIAVCNKVAVSKEASGNSPASYGRPALVKPAGTCTKYVKSMQKAAPEKPGEEHQSATKQSCL